ncbi:ABC transporter permease [Desulforamulus ruminis]|uniref:Binding-protein-dependent transport systems inner membrane component n=1 Tax=Desulforamulus ruminis (strain ATCC 23193 / DSM 2154 / NCIMB 8452 / DL) TaxID=696281 RepID=F6DVI5_DESRL|nr:ABC transporter permease [Desulforamulus ruminis]AEG61445.1 binding-protein-dependent transport systems inner membrane component [Desulforamulus ruminis DSM 2154]
MNFIVSVGQLMLERQELIGQALLEHVVLSLVAVFFITVAGVPLGILLTRVRKLAQPVIFLTGVLYTIPVLALFGFMIPLLGIGIKPTLFALFIYGLLPLVRNTYVGILGVDKNLIEAARGMGSTDWQLLVQVELPLALPVIVAGFRTVTVMTISVATIAAFIGSGGLGTLIFRGIMTYNTQLTVAGSILVALLALTTDGFLALLEKKLLKRTRGNVV